MSYVLQGGSDLFCSAHVSLRLFRSRRVLLLTRTRAAFQTPEELDRCVADLARALPLPARSGIGIIVDTRLAPLRVHPALDPAFTRFRRETERGFASVAVLVETQLGQLRATRLAAPAATPIAVVHSLEEALRFLDSYVAKVAC